MHFHDRGLISEEFDAKNNAGVRLATFAILRFLVSVSRCETGKHSFSHVWGSGLQFVRFSKRRPQRGKTKKTGNWGQVCDFAIRRFIPRRDNRSSSRVYPFTNV